MSNRNRSLIVRRPSTCLDDSQRGDCWRWCFSLLLVILSVGALASHALAGEGSRRQPKIDRELFVPFDDLHVLLRDGGRRVFLTRREYEQLQKQAKQETESASPSPANLVAAEYRAKVVEGRMQIEGDITIDVSGDRLCEIELPLEEIHIRSAMLDGDPASLSPPQNGVCKLFVKGDGQHTLRLEMVVPVVADVSHRSATFRLPPTATSRMQLTVPGNVEIRQGTDVIRRWVDSEKDATNFVLLPRSGTTTLEMSLNNRHSPTERVVVVRNVLVDEFTEAYERLHVTSSVQIRHGSIRSLRYRLPTELQVTNVVCPQMSRWQVSPVDESQNGQAELEITLRESVSESFVLNVTAERTEPKLAEWTMPQLEPMDVAGSVSIVGLLVERRLELRNLSQQGLIPVDVKTLTATLPKSVLDAEPGAPAIRPIAAYYAPTAEFELKARFLRPAGRVQVVSSLLLTIGLSGLEADGGFTLLPMAEDIFGCSFSVQPGWDVHSVTSGDDKPLLFERHDEEDGSARIQITLPHSIPPGQPYSIHFHARKTPHGWLSSWQTQSVKLPVFQVAEANRDRGAVAVLVGEDLAVQIDEKDGLFPLDANDRADYHLENTGTDLAFRFDARPFSGSLTVHRVEPRVTAETYSFFTIRPGELTSHYELLYQVGEARTRELVFELPASTPEEITISAADPVGIKEQVSETNGDWRRWIVSLTQPISGPVRLLVDFQTALNTRAQATAKANPETTASDASTQWSPPTDLPVIRATDVEYQSGILAIEGDAELEVRLVTNARKVDAGELVDAQYQPGKRLLGSYGFVGEPATVTVELMRPEKHGLPTAIVQRASLFTTASASGILQTAARYQLRTRAPFLEITLPTNSELWSVLLDGLPAKPQRDGKSLLVSLPAREDIELRDLQLVFETERSRLGMWGRIDVLAPELRLRREPNVVGDELPMAEIAWYVALPHGYRIAATTGNVFPDLQDATTRRALAGGKPTLEMDGGATLLESLSESASESAQDSEALLESESDLFSFEETSEPATKRAKKSASSSAYWALKGLRSLNIELQSDANRIAFRSLGAQPRLGLRVVDDQRLNRLSLFFGLTVFAVGLVLLRSWSRTKVRFLVSVLVFTVAIPPLLGWQNEMRSVLDCLWWSVLCLIPVYLAWHGWYWARYRFARSSVATAVLLLGTSVYAPFENHSAFAAQPEADWGPVTVQVVPPQPPLKVPKDVVIVPYDIDDDSGIENAKTVVVPYKEFLRLKATAFAADDTTQQASVPFAWAGARWETVLEEQDSLLVHGKLQIDSLRDTLIGIPVSFSRGVLEQATVDGSPARIARLQPDSNADRSPDNSPQLNQSQSSAPALQAEALIAIYIQGPGRHEVELSVRYPLERHGGWRVVRGKLPATPAASIELTIPLADTDLRTKGLVCRSLIETKEPDSRIVTALARDGQFEFQWRRRIERAAVDSSLTAESQAVFDVQEDSLRMVWKLDLSFARGERDMLTFLVPSEFVLERVDGDNIRDWKRDGRRVDVTLLRSARDSQSLTLHLVRRGIVGEGELAQFELPHVEVEGAVLHQGFIAIRRSSQFQIQTSEASGLTRTDLSAVTLAESVSNESPLGIVAFQAYEFRRTPYELQMSAGERPSRVTASVQTLFRVSEIERTVESRVLYRVQGNPIYQLQVDLPLEMSVRDVQAPGAFQWSVVETAVAAKSEVPDSVATNVARNVARKRLTVFLSEGQAGEFPLVIRGQVGDRGNVQSVAIPVFQVRHASVQHSTVVVQSDPGFDIRPADLQGCQTILLQKTDGWLKKAQRKLARIAVFSRTSEFSGTLKMIRRKSIVRGRSISNLRITPRAFEETVLLDFDISGAGIREVVFRLPADLRDCRIKAPLLRRKLIEDLDNGQIRVRLELQDEVMGQFRVLIEHDRLLTTGKRSIPIPVLETGSTKRRFVVIESAGRDEVVVAGQKGLEPVGRQQQEWAELSQIFGDRITQAFVVSANAREPSLDVQTQSRQAVETAGARILIAQAWLAVDESGAYRGRQVYQVDNRVEQFLEITKPTSARLWTAQVAGRPVKPVSGANGIRIPLVRTSAGDRDFQVVIKYGGVIENFSSSNRIEFPLIRTHNVQVEQSQVRMCLPPSHRWYRFGGAMRKVEQEDDLFAGFLDYRTSQLLGYCQNLSSDNPFTKARSLNNLRQLELSGESWDSSSRNDRFRQKLAEQERAMDRVREALQRSEEPSDPTQSANRAVLDDQFRRQDYGVTRGAVNAQLDNFVADEAAAPTSESGRQIRKGWIESNLFADTESGGKGKGKEDVQSRIVDVDELERVTNEGLRGIPGFGRFDAPNQRPTGQSTSRVQRFEQELRERQAANDSPQGGGGFGTNGYTGERRGRSSGFGPPVSIPSTPKDLTKEDPFALGSDGGLGGGLGGDGFGGGGIGGGGLVSAGLVSLDVELPMRGTQYFFTTPRGDVEISARHSSHQATDRWARLFLGGIGLTVLLVGGRVGKRR